jgi:hypothetical protein
MRKVITALFRETPKAAQSHYGGREGETGRRKGVAFYLVMDMSGRRLLIMSSLVPTMSVGNRLTR